MKKDLKAVSSNKSTCIAASSLVACSIAGIVSTASPANASLQFETLGTGAQIRASLLENHTVPVSVSPYAADHKGGEGKCGEGKCGGTKDDDSEKAPAPAPTPDKSGEGKCGEGKCGGSK
mgnify:CR=1 FL=1